MEVGGGVAVGKIVNHTPDICFKDRDIDIPVKVQCRDEKVGNSPELRVVAYDCQCVQGIDQS